MLKTLLRRALTGVAIGCALAFPVRAGTQIDPTTQIGQAGASKGQSLSWNGTGWNPAVAVAALPYDFKDTFTGSNANVGGRTPDTITNGNNWQVTGPDAASYTAGSGKLQDLGAGSGAYAVMHTTCTGAPAEIGGTYVTNGSSSGTPTIASMLNYATFGLTLPVPMVHPLVLPSSGTTLIQTTVYDSVARSGGSNISAQLAQFYNNVPLNVTNGASTAYNYREFFNGNYVTIRVELASTGAVLIQSTAYDPLISVVSGPDVFFELAPDSSYWTSAYAKCATATPNQTAASFPGGIDGTPIGDGVQAPNVNTGSLNVGLGAPNLTLGNFSVSYNPAAISAPSFSSAGNTNVLIQSTNGGSTAALTVQNGSGCATKLTEDGSFNLDLLGCNASHNAISMAANDGATTLNNTVNVSSLTASLPVFTDASKNLTSTGTNLIPNGDLAQAGANTVKGNATSGTANETDLAVGGCSAASDALIWTTNTGFGCNTAVNAAQLGGATMAVPGAIGGTTPAAITGTTVGANTQYNVNGHMLCSASAPTISSGFSSSGTVVTSNNGPCAFIVTIGTTPSSTGVIGLPTATTGWACKASDRTTHSTGVSQTIQTASTASSATFIQYSDIMAATAWTTGDVVVFNCFAY